MWANNNVCIQDKESWLEVLKLAKTPKLTLSGAWYTLTLQSGKTAKFQAKQWLNKLNEDEFRDSVIAIMDEVLINKYKQ